MHLSPCFASFAISDIKSPDVELEYMASVGAYSSISFNISLFIFILSGPFSWIKSTSLNASFNESNAFTLSSICFFSSEVTSPISISVSTFLLILFIPASSASFDISYKFTSSPFLANKSAKLAPITPAPITATLFISLITYTSQILPLHPFRHLYTW